MDQLLCHLVGDYWLQGDYVALNKSKNTLVCAIHCLLYTLPFLLITQSKLVLAAIFISHFFIDRFYLARYLIWVKNHLAPGFRYPPWGLCDRTGHYDAHDLEPTLRVLSYGEPRPFYISVWLMIICVNSLHVLCNYAALRWL